MSQQTRTTLQAQPKTADPAHSQSSILQRAAISPAITPIHSPVLQCCSNGVECEECRQKRLGTLQRAAVNTAPAHANGVPPIVHEVLNSPGKSLDSGTRAFMEPRFGHDFSGVRVHTDARAAESARAVNALAYTVGKDIVFGNGQYAPETSAGKRLMAHELTHTLQQANTGLRRKEGLRIGEPGDASEHEADIVASEILSSKNTHTALHNTVQKPQLQRAGLFESIFRLFGGGTFSDEELQEYLKFLDKTNHIEDHYDSDNKAREIVRRWQTGDALYILPLRRKVLLIKEMLTGFTSKADERGILALLRGSTATEFTEILKGIGIEELRSNMEGDERKQLNMLMETRPGQSGTTGDQQQGVAAKPDPEAFSAEKVLEAQELFAYNADLGPVLENVLRSISKANPHVDPLEYLRLNCVDIVRTTAPKPFAQDPLLAQRICQSLGKLKGQTLTMSEAESVSNAEVLDHLRLNCIDIVRTMAPGLFAQDPILAERVRQSLSKLKDETLTMPDAGRVLTELGAATGPTDIPFDNGNGNREPTTMKRSAWKAITDMAGTEGWHVFGLAVFNGYHSVTVFVDNRADGKRVYWADQWAIRGPQDAFSQEAGSVSGFRRYEQEGFDKFIEEKTRQWWNKVHSPDSRCGQGHPKTWDRSCRYTATLKIWHFRSGH